METDRVYRRYRTVLVEDLEETAKRLSAAAEQTGNRGPSCLSGVELWGTGP